MRDQQRITPTQEQRQDHRQQDRDRAAQDRQSMLSAQQWELLLRSAGDQLADLPAPLLEQLAAGIGNSSLLALLHQHGGEIPDPISPRDLLWDSPAPEENPIVTSPPELFSLSGAFDFAGSWPPPAAPSALRARG